MINENNLYATNGNAYPVRTLVWNDLSILDACTVRTDYGHLLLLAADGKLYGIDLDTGVRTELCVVKLPEIDHSNDNEHFGLAKFRLHASSDGVFAAIVVDMGQSGIVVDVRSGAITMHLDGGDYHQETVPFSACFLCFEGRNVLVYRTAWNRLDAADPATGKSLTDRYIAPYVKAGETPAHYLDYFHGALWPSPNGSRIFDDGWVWHPASIPRIWSVTDWLTSNPWESEDGASILDFSIRDDWNTPACWISERHLALWGLADSTDGEFTENGQGTGVQILDVTASEQSIDSQWVMETNGESIFHLLSDGKFLYATTNTGTTVWDLDSREQVTGLLGFTAKLLDQKRNILIAISATEIIEFSLSCLAQEKC